jgi:hypothetical protein
MDVDQQYPHALDIEWHRYTQICGDVSLWLYEHMDGKGYHATSVPSSQRNGRLCVRFRFETEDDATAFALKWT